MQKRPKQAIKHLVTVLLLTATLTFAGCFQPVPNRAPTASLMVTTHHRYAPATILFDATSSYDPDGSISSASWDFGDGESDTGLVVEHTYSGHGDYTAQLRVVDDQGSRGYATADIRVLEVDVGYLLCRYQWEYRNEPQYWDVLLPAALHDYYADSTRKPFIDNYKYDDYVLDPLDEPTLSDLAQALRNRVEGDYEGFAECTLSFVQGTIDYLSDPSGLEYPLYPLETLVSGKGDCEDTTILYVSLLRALGYSPAMGFVDTDGDDTPDHVLALAPISKAYRNTHSCPPGTSCGFLEIEDRLYAFAETTPYKHEGSYTPLGCDPWGLVERDFKRIWEL